VIEDAAVDQIYTAPRHPYTWGLLGSLPRMDIEIDRLVQVPGQPPSLLNPPAGCRFNPRCSYTMDRCRVEMPELRPSPQSSSHSDACFLDEATKAREPARLLAGMGTGAG
jgi:oligopeptide/dipeptide ABC transporter ATP-binding protein